MSKFRILMAPLIVFIGLIIYINVQALELKKETREDLKTIITNSTPYYHFDAEFTYPEATEFNVHRIKDFTEIKAALGELSFVLLYEQWGGNNHLNDRFCKNWGGGMSVYLNSEQTYVGIIYNYKRTLTGCKPYVSDIVEVNLGKNNAKNQ